MSSQALPHADAKFIVFTDFDGTITTEDSNDFMTDTIGFGKAKRRQLNLDILEGRKTFRDAFGEMIGSVAANKSFDECREAVKKHIGLDPGFKSFLLYCKEADVPVVIVSSGMAPIIRAVLGNLIGEEEAAKIGVISNYVDLGPDGKGKQGEWHIKFRHPESGFGHDKSRSTAPYRDLPQKPVLFFCGDGVSDLSAAKAADILFVKVVPGGTNDLAVHCEREGIKFTAFESFLEVEKHVASVVKGEKTVDEYSKMV